jgi:hypothetical protein
MTTPSVSSLFKEISNRCHTSISAFFSNKSSGTVLKVIMEFEKTGWSALREIELTKGLSGDVW